MHARIAGQSTIYTGAVDVNIPIGMPSGNESSQAPIFFLEKAHGFCNKSIHDLEQIFSRYDSISQVKARRHFASHVPDDPQARRRLSASATFKISLKK